jgi:hypothetical protein
MTPPGATRTKAERAVARGSLMVGSVVPYILGTGNRSGATRLRKADGSMTVPGFDCWGFADAFCYDHPRTDPGFNKGPWATVSDARNCDSAIEEAEHLGKVYRVVKRPSLGCLFVMPSIRDPEDKDGDGNRTERLRIGHVWLCVGVPAEWDEDRPQFSLCETIQCQASTHPAIKRGPGPKSDATLFRGLVDPAWRIRILEVI